MRIAGIVCAALFLALVGVFTVLNMRELPPEELTRRCDASNPAWNGYQEDIKEIGARPVARWHGEPVALEVLPDQVRLTLLLAPPWDTWDAALPLLVQDPEGQVHRNTRTERDGARRVYIFPPVASAPLSPPPWVEIQYPHTKRRIHLDVEGKWRAVRE